MYIGLDLGSSGLKGLLIGEDQSILAEAFDEGHALYKAAQTAIEGLT